MKGKHFGKGKMNENNFWKNKNVLITGHAGFKGSWLSLWLSMKGANITGLGLSPNYKPSLFKTLGLSDIVADLRCDINNYEMLKDKIKNTTPDIIIHMAAQPIVTESYKNPLSTYSTNVMGTVNILELSRTLPSVKAVVIVTSDKCYKNDGKNHSFSETDQLGGNDPYSSSKACAEIVTNAYRKSFFSNENKVGIATVRAGNVIGGGDWSKDRLIPDAIRSFIDDKNLIIRYPKATRPWQHVFEPISGYINLSEKLFNNPEYFSGAWNFGPKKESNQKVEDVCDYLISVWGQDKKWIKSEAFNYHEDLILDLKSDKSIDALNWESKWSWKTAIKKTIEWYKEFCFGDKLNRREFSQDQIKSFLEGN